MADRGLDLLPPVLAAFHLREVLPDGEAVLLDEAVPQSARQSQVA